MIKREITLPSGYDWDFIFRKTLRDSSKKRLLRLVTSALATTKEFAVGYELFGVEYNKPLDGFYCLKTHEVEEICIVSSSERGLYRVIAIFPIAHENTAAEYFVDLVSDGDAKIDWSLFLE